MNEHEERVNPSLREYVSGLFFGALAFLLLISFFDGNSERKLLCVCTALLIAQAIAHQLAKGRMANLRRQRSMPGATYRSPSKLLKKN